MQMGFCQAYSAPIQYLADMAAVVSLITKKEFDLVIIAYAGGTWHTDKVKSRVRSAEYPWGLADLPTKHLAQISKDNFAVLSIAYLAKAAYNAQTPFWIKMPRPDKPHGVAPHEAVFEWNF